MKTDYLKQKKALVVDCDGTVYLGRRPIKGSIDFVNRNSDRFQFFFMTNNTSQSRRGHFALLKKMGIRRLALERIISPVTACADYLHVKGLAPVFCLGTRRMAAELTSRGIRCTMSGKKARAVVAGYDTELTYNKLARAALLLHNKKTAYVATHRDLVCPGPSGALPDAGSFMALLKACTGRLPDKIFGKPDPAMLAPVLSRFARKEIVVIGDRIYTDKKLADCAKIDFILVLSGDTNRADLKRAGKKPLAIVDSLGKIYG
ncbi:MAG: HAD-IIA family hydrolase [Chitinivibrionales bacterium]|nr:HAD-IIA family hydrolase [Chitinivibrionales bacterium]